MTSIPHLAEWVAITSLAVGGGIWVGAVENQAATNTQNIAALAKVPEQMATLTERVENLKKAVEKVDDKQDQILDELRKK